MAGHPEGVTTPGECCTSPVGSNQPDTAASIDVPGCVRPPPGPGAGDDVLLEDPYHYPHDPAHGEQPGDTPITPFPHDDGHKPPTPDGAVVTLAPVDPTDDTVTVDKPKPTPAPAPEKPKVPKVTIDFAMETSLGVDCCSISAQLRDIVVGEKVDVALATTKAPQAQSSLSDGALLEAGSKMVEENKDEDDDLEDRPHSERMRSVSSSTTLLAAIDPIMHESLASSFEKAVSTSLTTGMASSMETLSGVSTNV